MLTFSSKNQFLGHNFLIVDKPNHRSSHEIVTIRGGDVFFLIFSVFSVFMYFIYSGFEYPFFVLILFSLFQPLDQFTDDIKPLNTSILY